MQPGRQHRPPWPPATGGGRMAAFTGSRPWSRSTHPLAHARAAHQNPVERNGWPSGGKPRVERGHGPVPPRSHSLRPRPRDSDSDRQLALACTLGWSGCERRPEPRRSLAVLRPYLRIPWGQGQPSDEGDSTTVSHQGVCVVADSGLITLGPCVLFIGS